MSRALKRLPIPGHCATSASTSAVSARIPTFLSELTPTSSSIQAQIIQLTTLFKTHLKENPTSLSPNELVHFMKTRLRHHPMLSHLDFYLFRYTATLDSFRHDHSTFEYMARSLVYGRMIRDMVMYPNMVTFNTLIIGYCRSNKFALASDVFQEMKDKGCLPNVVSFNTLIKGFFQDGKTAEAIGMAHEMIDLRCKFSCATCVILIDGLCRKEKIVEASDLMIDFLREGGSAATLVRLSHVN